MTTTKKATAKVVEQKTDDTLAIATLTAALISRGHNSATAVELAKNLVEEIRELA